MNSDTEAAGPSDMRPDNETDLHSPVSRLLCDVGQEMSRSEDELAAGGTEHDLPEYKYDVESLKQVRTDTGKSWKLKFRFPGL